MDKERSLQSIPEADYRSHHPATAELDLRIFEMSNHGNTATQIAMVLHCSESTVYRARRRIQEFVSAQNYGRFLQVLRNALDQHPPSFDGNTQSALEVLYTVYAENNEQGTAECEAGFLALDELLSDLPLATTDPVFDKVCALCSCYERSGFTGGFKLGVHMANELSA